MSLITIYKLYGDKNFDEKIKTSGINFGGISALEQYAECADIRRLVEKTLSGFKLDVILVKLLVIIFGKVDKARPRTSEA